jgi:hypothetical protein
MTKLWYGGQEFKITDADADAVISSVQDALVNSPNVPTVMQLRLSRGVMTLAASSGIPIAVETYPAGD